MNDILDRLKYLGNVNCSAVIRREEINNAAAEIARLRERVRVLREECAASRCALKADGTTFPMGYRQKQRYINARSATDAAKAMEEQ